MSEPGPAAETDENPPSDEAGVIDSPTQLRIWHLAISCIRRLRDGVLKPTSRPMTDTEHSEPNPDDAADETAEDSFIETPMADRLEALAGERDEMRERWMRAEAEMANLRARTKREVEDARLFAVQKFARDVVEVAENLKRGLDSLPTRGADEPEIIGKLREGFEGIERSFVATLERNGVKTDDPTGKLFDANLHQAMAEQESAEHPPGTIIQSWTQAWTLNGRLLRPAMVVVAKAPTVEVASETMGEPQA
jgi:molecular chaperone GrpE